MNEYSYTLEIYREDKRKKEGRRKVNTIEIVAKDPDSAADVGLLYTGKDDKLSFEVHKTFRLVCNAMTGKAVEEHYATPYSCSVASETYWCS